MFSSGHILFIFFSAVWIISGTVFLRKKNPPMRKVLLTCLAIAMLSEFIKILGNIEIVPIVEPIVEQGKLIYRETGAYTPYLEAEHFPFELCSYQIIFILLALAVRNPRLQKRLYALMYTTCIAGDGMEILLLVGIDTFTLNGDGLRPLVVEGETVSKGQPVMEADLERIRQAGLSPMVITVLSS